MLILTSLSAIAVLLVLAPTVLGAAPRPAGCRHAATSRDSASAPPFVLARSDVVGAPRNETIYIPPEPDFSFWPRRRTDQPGGAMPHPGPLARLDRGRLAAVSLEN